MVLWSSDVGYNFLVCFFAFWIVQILIGVYLKFKNLGITHKNFKFRVRELYHNYIHQLEQPNNRKHS